ncbi:MAG: chemotaxis protein CheW [Pseudomonadota bacterium]
MTDETQAVDVGEREYVAFRVGDEEYSIEIKRVREIRRWTTATKLPHAPSYLTGVVNLRGSVVPVVDFSARLGGGATETTERHTIIIIEGEGQTIGLLVDSVSDILSAGAEHMQPTPQIAPPEVHEVISGLIVVDDRILRRVDVRNILETSVAEQADVADVA